MEYFNIASISLANPGATIGATTSATTSAAAQAACAELTGLQKLVGLLNFFTLLEIFAFFAICWSIGVLCPGIFRYLRRMFASVPLLVYEIGLYLLCIGCAVCGLLIPGKPFEWGLAACLLWPAALLFSAKQRQWKENPNNFFTAMLFAWSLLTLLYESQVLGFFAIAALMARMGFAIGIGRLCYAIGFTNRDVVAQASCTALLVLSFFVGMQIMQWDLAYLAAFASGGMWLGCIVLFSGLLIMASKWYPCHSPYWLMQILTISACIAALAIGNLWQINLLRGFGGTFLVFYLLEKPFEIPLARRQAYAALALAMSLLLIAGMYWAKQNMSLLAKYLPL